MTLTKAQRRKLAKAARDLAGEYAEGCGPDLLNWTWCGCAAGQLFVRAGVPNVLAPDTYALPAEDLDASIRGILTEATDKQCGGVYAAESLPGAVVFPLLWLADELESQP